MRSHPTITLAAITVVVTISIQTAPAAQAAAPMPQGADVKARLNSLPPAVKATVEAETRHATLKGVSEEKENGKTVYELESIVEGRTRDLMIDSAGRVYLVEEELDVDKAPPAVKAALEARGRIVRLESVSTEGKTHFEGHVRTRTGQTVAIELGASGKPLKK